MIAQAVNMMNFLKGPEAVYYFHLSANLNAAQIMETGI